MMKLRLVPPVKVALLVSVATPEVKAALLVPVATPEVRVAKPETVEPLVVVALQVLAAKVVLVAIPVRGSTWNSTP